MYYRHLILIVTLAMALEARVVRAVAPDVLLDNGLAVFLRPIEHADRVAIVVSFGIGQDRDPVGKAGVAHLLEHLYVTSAAGDAPLRTYSELNEQWPLGYNAQTAFDHTVIAGTCRPQELEEQLIDAAARMADLKITQADLDREKQRVLTELRNMYERIPQLAGMNNVRSRLRPRPDRGRFGGELDAIEGITLGELQAYWADYYKPNHAVLSIVGGFDEQVVRRLVEERFGPISRGKPLPAVIEVGAPGSGLTKVRLEPIVSNAKPGAAIGYVAPLPGTRQYPAFMLVVGRLFAATALQNPPPSGHMPLYFTPLDDGSVIVLQSPIGGGGADASIHELELRLTKALDPPVQPGDITRFNQTLGPMLGTVPLPDEMFAQNPYMLAFSLARRYQLKLDGATLGQEIAAVTDEDIKRLAAEVFADHQRVTVITEIP